MKIYYHTYKPGDFTVELPARDMWAVVNPIRDIVNLRREFKYFQEVGVGTKPYDGRAGEVPITVQMSRSGDDASIRFTHANEEGHKVLLQIAQVLGVPLEPLEPAAKP